METIIDYLDNIRDTIFKEVPFNELDALIFSRLSYINYSYVVNKKLDCFKNQNLGNNITLFCCIFRR